MRFLLVIAVMGLVGCVGTPLPCGKNTLGITIPEAVPIVNGEWGYFRNNQCEGIPENSNSEIPET